MGLFGTKNKKQDAQKAEEVLVNTDLKDAQAKNMKNNEPKVVSVGDTLSVGIDNLYRILIKPRITEKATEGNVRGVYVFDVASDANKNQIRDAVRSVYKVDPVRVNIVSVQSKKVRNARTGIIGVKSGGKKAYVYLRDGDSISIM